MLSSHCFRECGSLIRSGFGISHLEAEVGGMLDAGPCNIINCLWRVWGLGVGHGFEVGANGLQAKWSRSMASLVKHVLLTKCCKPIGLACQQANKRKIITKSPQGRHLPVRSICKIQNSEFAEA